MKHEIRLNILGRVLSVVASLFFIFILCFWSAYLFKWLLGFEDKQTFLLILFFIITPTVSIIKLLSKNIDDFLINISKTLAWIFIFNIILFGFLCLLGGHYEDINN
jgi:hypothetical protein